MRIPLIFVKLIKFLKLEYIHISNQLSFYILPMAVSSKKFNFKNKKQQLGTN